jgi:glutamyl-tRNA synthetase
MTITVRYAPSPTGRLHLGNARPALINWVFARRHGGTYVLRLDDTDRERSTEAFARGIVADLDWLGILPDLMVRQFDRTALYDAARDRLIASGRLYPAYETEEELERRRAIARASGRPPVYDRAALKLTAKDRTRLQAEGREAHWRFRLDGRRVGFDDLIKGPQSIDTASMSDPVLVRADGSYLYTLPSVVDDIELGITHVIRGEDHVSNTGVQIELTEALGGTVPAYAHHNLLVGAEGEGLSKRLGSLSLAELREAGYEPQAVAAVAVLTGTSAPVQPDLVDRLDLGMISHGPARFDPAELESVNARLLHAMSYEVARPRLAALGLESEPLWLALRENLTRFGDIVELARIVTGPVEPVVAPEDREFLAAARALMPPEPWNEGTWKLWTEAVKAATGRKGRALFHPLRLALTGRESGPELSLLLPLVGRKASLDRLP